MDFKRTIIIDKPAPEVWKVLGDQFGKAYQWASGLKHSKGYGDPQLPGATYNNRACETSQGPIKEAIREYDANNYRLVYEVIEGFPFFVDQGINRWTLEPEGNRTRVNMHLSVTTKGLIGTVMSPMMKLQMGSITSNVIDDFKHYVETGEPSPRKAKEIAKQAA